MHNFSGCDILILMEATTFVPMITMTDVFESLIFSLILIKEEKGPYQLWYLNDIKLILWQGKLLSEEISLCSIERGQGAPMIGKKTKT